MLNKFLVPDQTVTEDELCKYGYLCGDFYPVSRERAKELFRLNRLEVFWLGNDNTECLIESEDAFKELEEKEVFYGIYKTDWLEFITREATRTLINMTNAENEIEKYFIREFGYVPTDKQLDHIYEAIANET